MRDVMSCDLVEEQVELLTKTCDWWEKGIKMCDVMSYKFVGKMRERSVTS
jgi:hypothetical protein